VKQSEQINELAKALVAFQSEVEAAVKDAKNPHFKSKFASLESVWDVAREPLKKNGIAVIQLPDEGQDGRSVLVTTVLHTSGQFIQASMPLMPIKNEPQAQGSAITYARRYALAAALGIIQTDDDAESAQGRAGEPFKSSLPSMKSLQPVPGDGETRPVNGYRLTNGAYKGRALTEVPEFSLRQELARLEKRPNKDHDELQQMDRIAEFLKLSEKPGLEAAAGGKDFF
jgi:hypothetical protein